MCVCVCVRACVLASVFSYPSHNISVLILCVTLEGGGVDMCPILTDLKSRRDLMTHKTNKNLQSV